METRYNRAFGNHQGRLVLVRAVSVYRPRAFRRSFRYRFVGRWTNRCRSRESDRSICSLFTVRVGVDSGGAFQRDCWSFCRCLAVGVPGNRVIPSPFPSGEYQVGTTDSDFVIVMNTSSNSSESDRSKWFSCREHTTAGHA